MTSDDLEKLRREYDVYEKLVVGLIQTRLGLMSTFSKLLSACKGVSSSAQTALEALKEVGEGVTVAEFEAAHPDYSLAGPIALHLKRWERRGGLPDLLTGPIPLTPLQ